jgi:adenylate cyclase
MRQLPDWTEAYTMQAAAYSNLGRVDDARQVVQILFSMDGKYSLKRAVGRHPYRNAADREKLANALMRAGLS